MLKLMQAAIEIFERKILQRSSVAYMLEIISAFESITKFKSFFEDMASLQCIEILTQTYHSNERGCYIKTNLWYGD